MPTICSEARIINQLGVHARPATKLVRTASASKSEVFFEKDGQRVNGKSILGVMLLQAEMGSTLKIEVIGEDAEQVTNALLGLIRNRFGEE